MNLHGDPSRHTIWERVTSNSAPEGPTIRGLPVQELLRGQVIDVFGFRLSFARALIVLVAIVCLASACGSDPGESAAGGDASVSVGDSAPPTGDDATPLEAMLGAPVFDESAMNAWFAELDVEAQRLIAECMLAEGFQYAPEVRSAPTGTEAEAPIGSKEYAESFGFGIAVAFEAAEFDADNHAPSTNSEYLASLTPGERDAFSVALTGSVPDERGDSDPFAAEGCQGESYRQVFEVIATLDEILPVAQTHYEAFLADGRAVQLDAEWNRCMAEGGYDFVDSEDMRESFYRRLDGIVSKPGAFEPDDDLPVEAPVELPTFSGDAYSLHPPLTDEAQAEVDTMAGDEIATAVAAWECEQPLAEERTAIRAEYEQRIVDEVTN